MKLCIGDVVKVKSGAIGIVDHIEYRDEDNCLSENKTTYLGKGMELDDIEDFSIIPNKEVKWAWYKAKELVEIIYSANRYSIDNPEGEEDE